MLVLTDLYTATAFKWVNVFTSAAAMYRYAGALQDWSSLHVLSSLVFVFSASMHGHICRVQMGGGGGVGMVYMLCAPPVRVKYNKVCRHLVKQSQMEPINCITPCKHDSLSAKKWLVDSPLLTMTYGVEL